MSPQLQEYIHKFEVGEGTRHVRNAVLILSLLALAAAYDWRQFRNLGRPEAMDVAQVARNLARGEGFTTKSIRPLSLHLVASWQARHPGQTNDLPRLRTGHPDLANPPVYPLLLAAAMKVLPFDYGIPEGGFFRRYQPDVLITLVNQALFLVLIVLVFRLARTLFDASVAWTSALVLAGTELMWRFTASGLPTLLLMILFVALAGCLVSLERAAREATRSTAWLVGMAAVAGIVVGMGMLARYAFGWLALPLLLFLALFFPQHRVKLPLAAGLAFAVLVSPWLARNYSVSGTLFGTPGFALFEQTASFPGDTLERSLEPKLESRLAGDCLRKLRSQVGGVIQNDIPRMGGNWMSALFLAGLLVPFVSPARGRLRVWLLSVLGVLALVQTLAGRELPADTPDVSAGNLLVVAVPLVFIFGTAMFHLLLDHVQWAVHGLRVLATGLLVVVTSVPLLIALLPPRADPRVHPPYHPPLIQQMARWMEPGELMMSDIPWAVAWYGDHPCLWTTLKASDPEGKEDFFAVNDLFKPVHALYLTSLTLDGRLFSDDLSPAREGSWGRFAVDALVRTTLPPGFPLKSAHQGLPRAGHFFLTDRRRWARPEIDEPGAKSGTRTNL